MKSSPLNDINNADQHRVMDVRVNQSRSGVRMLPWVSECGERNPGIASLISRAREAGDRILRSFRGRKSCLTWSRGGAIFGRLPLATIWNRYAIGWV